MAKTIDERVAEAAEKLVASGRKLTLDAVREALGSGSFRDIAPALRKWKDSSEQAGAEASPIPPELMAMLERTGNALWSAAEARANERVNDYRVKSDAKVEAIEEERDEALSENGRLEAQLAESRAVTARVQLEISAATAKAERAEGRVEALEAERLRLEEAVRNANRAEHEARDREQQARDEAAELRGQCRALSEQVSRLEQPPSARTSKAPPRP